MVYHHIIQYITDITGKKVQNVQKRNCETCNCEIKNNYIKLKKAGNEMVQIC